MANQTSAALVGWLVLCAGGMVVVACSASVVGTGAPGGGAAGGATSAQITSCKGSCDKMKFFQCNSASEQARCYTECDGASGSQIEVFNGCAGNSICDPACRTSIAPPATGGGTTGGGGASAMSCDQACSKLVECSFVKVGEKSACVGECTKSAYQYQIDCVVGTACDKMVAQCGSPGEGSGGSSGSSGTTSGGTSGTSGTSGGSSFDVMRCQSACDSMQFFDCITATEHGACRNSCMTAAAAKRDTFTSCANGAGGQCEKAVACYATFK